MLKVYKRSIGTISILCLQGRVVIGATLLLRKAVLAEMNCSAVALDFARVTRLDAHGIGVLLELREHCISKGIEFQLVNVSALVQSILHISRLTTVFEIVTEENVVVRTSPNRFDVVLRSAPCA